MSSVQSGGKHGELHVVMIRQICQIAATGWNSSRIRRQPEQLTTSTWWKFAILGGWLIIMCFLSKLVLGQRPFESENGKATSVRDFGTSKWLARWREFSADLNEKHEGRGESIAGGVKFCYRKKSIAVAGNEWHIFSQEVSRGDSSLDRGVRSTTEALSTKHGCISVRFEYGRIALRNEDLTTGDPFLYLLRSKGEGPGSSNFFVTLTEKAIRAPSSIPLIMECSDGDQEPGGAIRQMLLDKSIAWDQHASVANRECIGFSVVRPTEKWRILVDPSANGAVLFARRDRNSNHKDDEGRTFHELEWKATSDEWRIERFVDDWSQFDFVCDSTVQYLDGTSRTNKGEFQVRNAKYGLGKDSMRLKTKIPNGKQVFLTGQEQINAEWRDGKVVRVYNKEAIETLADLSFVTSKPSLFRWWPTAIGIVAAVILFYVWVRRRKPMAIAK